jgi:hypothetical protein
MRYNLTLQQPLPGGVNLRAGYVGMRGNHLFRGYEANLYPPAVVQPNGEICLPGNAATVRPQDINPACPPVPASQAGPLNPAFASLGLNSTDAQAFYNALQLAAGLSRTNGSIQGNYTFAKSVDDASQPSSGSNTDFTRQYPHLRTLERGLSEFDIRHRLSINFFYTLPTGMSRRLLRSNLLSAVLDGWRIGGVLSFRTGTAFHPLANVRRPGYLFSANRPSLGPAADNNPTGGVSLGCLGINAGEALGGPDRYFDPCAFVAADPGRIGNSGRNTIIGPSVFNTDLSLQKEFVLTGEKKLQFRAEMFNLPNHPNFAPPSRVSQIARSGAAGNPNPSAGQLFNTITTSRQLQFALRLTF